MKNLLGQAYKNIFDFLHKATKSVPVRTAHSLSIAESYLSSLRRKFDIIPNEVSTSEDYVVLQMTLKAISDFNAPGGLAPTLIFYRALSRLGPSSDLDHLSTCGGTPQSNLVNFISFRDAKSARGNGDGGMDLSYPTST